MRLDEVIHCPLEGGRAVRDTHRDPLKLVELSSSLESGEFSLRTVDFYMIIGAGEMHNAEEVPPNLAYQIFYVRERVCVEFSEPVDGLGKVYHQALLFPS